MPANAPARNATVDTAEWLTRVAFYLCLVLVLLRVTITEQLREAFDFGDIALPPGPSTTLLLNAAALLPALLILLRRAIDRSYVLQNRWSHLPLLLLAAWVAFSCTWASDQFAALISATTWCAASALAWAMSQLVRSWLRLRFVTAAVFGLLMILIAQTAIYYFFEAPAMVREWDSGQRDRLFAERRWTPDNPMAIQFDLKVRRGEVLAFYHSPNTLAAIATLAATLTLALALQRWRDGKDPLLTTLPVLTAVGAVPILLLTDSRTAIALCGLALVSGIAAYAFRRAIVRRRKAVYILGCIVAVAGVLLVIGIGLTTGGLLHDSLTFRWRYWVGSFALLRTHPWIGVGWENFGASYLAHRLPQAVEEIKDPHNLLVRFATETGVVGLALLILWLARSAWELATPAVVRSRVPSSDALKPTAAIVSVFVLLQLIARGPQVYLTADSYIELCKLALFAALLAGGLLIGSVRSSETFLLDNRRARWLVGGTALGLLVFLLHNMVDFALFETGITFLFMALLGASLGVRKTGNTPRNTPAAIGALAASAAVFLAFVLLIVVPTLQAESRAAEARALLAKNLPERATTEYRAAFTAAPVANADYLLQAADAYRTSGSAKPQEWLALLTQAINADPLSARGWLERARAQQTVSQTLDAGQRVAVENDYLSVLKLDPSSTQARLEYARFLDLNGIRDRALAQYRLALWYSDLLPEVEIRRPPNPIADEVRQRISVLESGSR
jgi:O-antigen ligase